jgi:hypothetical protein
MKILIDVIAVLALVMAYDSARPMGRKTNHGIRAALWMRGLGAVLAIWGALEIAVLVFMAATIVHRLFDRRKYAGLPMGNPSGAAGVAGVEAGSEQPPLASREDFHPGAGLVLISSDGESVRRVAA